MGIVLATVIKPGSGVSYDASPELEIKVEKNLTSIDTLMDFVRSLFPSNIFQAFTQQLHTTLHYPSNDTIPKHAWDFSLGYRDSTNILGLIMFSIMFGLALSTIGEKGRPVLDFMDSFNAVITKLTLWLISLAPIANTILLATSIVSMENPKDTFESLAWYVFTVVLGLSIHATIVLPIIFGLFTRSWPFVFIKNMGSALATALATRSSQASLPLTLTAFETRNDIDPRISRFIFPIGAILNMDGAAIYCSVTAIFIAQVRDMDLETGQAAAISITATFASIIAAAGPGAGMVSTIMVLQTVGISSKYMALVVAIDWVLDG